ncbi:HupE/UreJ family protein [Candidatus Puniceispirillum sp.]|nr:HupE/UreJ family protein [Candidatus Puniceispirillum sp.]
MSDSKALTYPIVVSLYLLLIGVLTTPAMTHEIRPAVADLIIIPETSIDPPSSQLQITIDFNAEMFLAGLDASLVSDTDDAPQGKDYDLLRSLPAVDLVKQFSQQWPRFQKALTGISGTYGLEFKFKSLQVEENFVLSLPRSSKLSIYAALPADNSAIKFGWDSKLGPLVLRQQSKTENLDDLYTAYLSPGSLSAPISRHGQTAQATLMVMADYIKAGFVHIVPKGLDHILFVLGLFFYAARWQPLLVQVTIFTAAHSMTLILASTGYIILPPSLIEPLIAISIIYVAFENVRRKHLNAVRLFVIFGFGLLHGIGFASVLNSIGLSKAQYILSLVSFNIGVELGQLAVLAPTFLLFGVMAGNALWYQKKIAIPASYLIGAAGLWMLITRVIAS